MYNSRYSFLIMVYHTKAPPISIPNMPFDRNKKIEEFFECTPQNRTRKILSKEENAVNHFPYLSQRIPFSQTYSTANQATPKTAISLFFCFSCDLSRYTMLFNGPANRFPPPQPVHKKDNRHWAGFFHEAARKNRISLEQPLISR